MGAPWVRDRFLLPRGPVRRLEGAALRRRIAPWSAPPRLSRPSMEPAPAPRAWRWRRAAPRC